MKIAFNPSNSSKNILDLIKTNKDIIFDLKGHSIYARGVEFKGIDTNTWRDIKVNNVSIGSNTLDLRNGDNTALTNINGVVTINSTWRPVVDNLTSNSTTSSLSANQGRFLKALIDGKSDSDHNHDGRYVRAFGTSDDNIDSDWGQSFKTFDPIPLGTPPEKNPNISLLSIGENFRRRKQLAFVYSSDNIYYRRHVDDGFTNWKRIAFANEIPSSLKNPYALTISLNGTSQGPYDGSAAKSINITPGSIGAATSGHNHDGRYVYNYGGTPMEGSSSNKNALGMSTTSGISGDQWHILQAAWNGEYRWNSQIAFPTQNRNGMYYRSGLDDNTKWGAWVKLLDAGNSSISGNTITINGSSLVVSKSDHNHDGRYVRYYTVTTLDCNNLAAGLTVAKVNATNAGAAYHSAYLYISDVGTPFQIQIPDSGTSYIYKRYYSSGKWSRWFKLNAGYADSAGSVNWSNVANKPATATRWPSWDEVGDKPSTFTPSYHNHDERYVRKWTGVQGGANKFLKLVIGVEKGWIRLEVSDSNNALSGGYGIYIIGWGYNSDNLAVRCLYANDSRYTTALKVVRTSRNNYDFYFQFASGSSYPSYTINYSSSISSIDYTVTAVDTIPTATWISSLSALQLNASQVDWSGIINKPLTFNPAAHTHTVFRNNLMIKGTNGISDSASIHLGIGDSDTGFKWISDGKCQIYANNVAIGQWTPEGMNWFANPTVNGNKVWNAGNDGSGSGLDADTVDGEHASNFSYSHQSSFNFNTIKNGRIVTFDQSNTDYNWINGFASTHGNYLTSVLFNTHRTSNWYVGYIEGDASTGKTKGLQAVHKLAFADQIPTSLKNPYSLTLKANGTTLAIYDGSSAKEANFTYANVGAASASHYHTYIVAEDLRYKYPAQVLDPCRMKLSFLDADTLGIENNGTWYDVITVRSYKDGSGGHDNALLFSKNTNSLYHTSFSFGATDSWGSPLLIIDSGNIRSQTVANAYHLYINSANSWSTWYWAGQSGQPSWLWGSNDGTNMYLWNPNNFNVHTAQYLRSLGNQNCQTGRTQAYGDVYTYNTLKGNTGSPTSYTSVIGFGRGSAGTVEIAGGWCDTNLYWRSLRDCCEDWHSWRTVLDSDNYTEFIGNYYWANVKISTSANTQTTPSVNTIFANNWFRSQGATGWYNESYGGGIHMTDTEWIRTFGGKSFYCDSQISSYGFHHLNHDNNDAILLAGGDWRLDNIQFRQDSVGQSYSSSYPTTQNIKKYSIYQLNENSTLHLPKPTIDLIGTIVFVKNSYGKGAKVSGIITPCNNYIAGHTDTEITRNLGTNSMFYICMNYGLTYSWVEFYCG